MLNFYIYSRQLRGVFFNCTLILSFCLVKISIVDTPLNTIPARGVITQKHLLLLTICRWNKNLIIKKFEEKMRIATFFSLKRQVKKRFFVKRAMYL